MIFEKIFEKKSQNRNLSNIFLYFCSGLISSCLKSPLEENFLQGGGAGRVAYAEQSMVESKKRHRDTMRALGGGKNSPDILKAFT